VGAVIRFVTDAGEDLARSAWVAGESRPVVAASQAAARRVADFQKR